MTYREPEIINTYCAACGDEISRIDMIDHALCVECTVLEIRRQWSGQFYHGADHNIWSYCIPLGQLEIKQGYTQPVKAKYDLGIYVEGSGWANLAVVYGGDDHEYISGDISGFNRPHNEHSRHGFLCILVTKLYELYRRDIKRLSVQGCMVVPKHQNCSI